MVQAYTRHVISRYFRCLDLPLTRPVVTLCHFSVFQRSWFAVNQIGCNVTSLSMARWDLILVFCASGFHIFLGVFSVCLGVILSIQAEVWLAHSVSPIWSGGIVSKHPSFFILMLNPVDNTVKLNSFRLLTVFHHRTCWNSLCQKENVICGMIF